jgi:hypothetical protein
LPSFKDKGDIERGIMATAIYRKFDVKHGLTVNGLPFVDEQRNVIINDLTVQGVSTIVDTRTITTIDPVITLGGSGKTYTSTEVITGTPGKIKFSKEDFSDIAVGDAIKYETGVGGVAPTGLTSGTVYYVVSKVSDSTNSDYLTITISETQGGGAIAISTVGSGDQEFTLNPLRDLDQDLGIEFNYVDTTPKKGFFGYKNSTDHFTFLLDTAYSGSGSQGDSGTPSFTGTKGGIEVKYAKLQPTSALDASTPAIDIDQNWNASGVAFKAFELDIVDTASSSSSSLLDIAVDGSQKLLLRKDGALAINSGSYGAVLNINQGSIAENTLIKGSATWNNSGTTFYGIDLSITDSSYAAGSKLLRLDAGAGQQFLVDITGEIDSAQTWNSSGTVFTGIDLQVTETSFAAGSKLVNFFASSSRNFSVDAYGLVDVNSEFTGGTLQTAITLDVTDTSSDPNSLLLDLQVGGISKFNVDKSGNISASGAIEVAGSGDFQNYIDIQTQPNSSGTYEGNTRFSTSYVTISAGSSTAAVINTFDRTEFVTGKYLVQMKQGANYHSAEVLLIHDGSGAFMTEYAAIWNTSPLGLLDAGVSGNNVNLTFTPTSATVAANAEVQVRITRISMTD